VRRELQRLYSGLGVLEELCGLPKTDLSSLLDIAGSGTARIEKYAFVSDTPLDAAKKYLRMIAPKQKAASLEEILAALESGGLKPNRDELRLSLSRSTVEIYKAGEDVYGLVENFPNVKRGTPGRKKSTNGSTAAVVEYRSGSRSFKFGGPGIVSGTLQVEVRPGKRGVEQKVGQVLRLRRGR
jgi:hypothetical protein